MRKCCKLRFAPLFFHIDIALNCLLVIKPCWTVCYKVLPRCRLFCLNLMVLAPSDMLAIILLLTEPDCARFTVICISIFVQAVFHVLGEMRSIYF